MNDHVRWVGAFLSLAVLLLVAVMALNLGEGDSELVVGQPSEPGLLSDGRGNELVAVGDIAGEHWYCETEGVVASQTYQNDPTGEENNEPALDVLDRALRGTALAGRVTEVAGESTLFVDERTVQTETSPATLTRVAALGLVPEDGSAELVILVHDPNRPEHQASGFMRLELWEVEGWVPIEFRMCGSAFTGAFEPVFDEELDEKNRADENETGVDQ